MRAGIAVTRKMRRFSARYTQDKIRKRKKRWHTTTTSLSGSRRPFFAPTRATFDPPSFPNPRVRNAANGRQLPWVCRTVYLWHVVLRQRTADREFTKTPHWEQSITSGPQLVQSLRAETKGAVPPCWPRLNFGQVGIETFRHMHPPNPHELRWFLKSRFPFC